MKQIALVTLILALLLSLFNVFGADLSNNSVAVALMILLLAVFSDLAEFNFWGISGKKKVEQLKKLSTEAVINPQTEVEKPSTYKIRKATKEDVITELDSLKDNYLALAYDLERVLRIVAKSMVRTQADTAELSPDDALLIIEKSELLTPPAIEAILSIREVRELLTTGKNYKVSLQTLEASFKLAKSIYVELNDWLTTVGK